MSVSVCLCVCVCMSVFEPVCVSVDGESSSNSDDIHKFWTRKICLNRRLRPPELRRATGWSMQTDRQTDRQTHKHTDKQTGRHRQTHR